MPKYRLQWPIEIVDCYDCGKGLHFQKPWRRVYKPRLLGTPMEIVLEQARIVTEWNSGSIFSKQGLVNIQDGKVVNIPKVGSFTFGEHTDDK